MEMHTFAKSKTLFVVFWVVLGLLLCLRINPAVNLTAYGDEGADFNTIHKDYLALKNFFDPDVVIAQDQARLSHLIAAFVIAVSGMNNVHIFKNIGVIRLTFLLIHFIYIIVSYRFIADVLKSRGAAYIYAFFLAVSCYLASYSAALMTTGESVFLLFQTLAMWIFFINFRKSLAGGVFGQFALLSLMISCSIAAKLFGVLLLFAFFGFHLFNLSATRTLAIAALSPGYLLASALGFLGMVIAVNIIPLPLQLKTIIALSLGLLYLTFWIVLAVLEKKARFATHQLHFIHFWALLTLCCFTLVLVFSPIYLNFENLLHVFDWFNDWGALDIQTESSKIDAIVILLVKFGLIPTFLLFMTSLVMIRPLLERFKRDRPDFFKNIYFLLFLFVFLNLALISFIRLKLPWHGISVFPFLYLPFIALFLYALKQKSKVFMGAMIAIVIIVSADNLYRYAYWYPYGHLDGGQYGRDFIGINKPCLISFEVVPQFYDYFVELNKREKQHYRSVNVKGSDVGVLNQYLVYMLSFYFSFKGHKEVTFKSNNLAGDHSDLIVSSPIFTPDVETQLKRGRYKKLKTISIVNISVATVWAGKTSKAG